MPDRHSRSLQAAVRRSRWLAELAGALDEADRLAQRIGAQDPRHSGGLMLRAQITALRGEVALLQRGAGRDSTD